MVRRKINKYIRPITQMKITKYFHPLLTPKGHYCPNCKRSFVSHYHRSIHIAHIDSVCRRQCHAGPPIAYRIQHLNEADLHLICTYLNFRDLVAFIGALDRLLLVHGMKRLWCVKLYRQPKISFAWLYLNRFELQRIDAFLVGLDQRRDVNYKRKWHQFKTRYINSGANFVEERRHIIWSAGAWLGIFKSHCLKSPQKISME